MSANKRIFSEGFASCLFGGIAIKTGIDVDESGILILILKTFCKATEGMQTQFNCWGYVILISILAIVVSFVALIEIINTASEWKTGVFIYGAGFI